MIDDSNSFVHNVFFRINKRFKSQSIHEIILLLFKKGVHFSHSRGVNFQSFSARRPQPWWASLVTEPQPPQSQKCGYGPVFLILVDLTVPQSFCFQFFMKRQQVIIS